MKDGVDFILSRERDLVELFCKRWYIEADECALVRMVRMFK